MPKKKTSEYNLNKTLLSISYGIATMFLEDAIKKGHGLEIPSLGIKIDSNTLCEKSNVKEEAS